VEARQTFLLGQRAKKGEVEYFISFSPTTKLLKAVHKNSWHQVQQELNAHLLSTMQM